MNDLIKPKLNVLCDEEKCKEELKKSQIKVMKV